MRFLRVPAPLTATAVYPHPASNIVDPALGLCARRARPAEKVKKAIRDDGWTITEERREAIAAELGDVLWYAPQLATEAGLDLEAIAEANLEKLGRRGSVARPARLGRQPLDDAALAARSSRASATR